MSISASLKTTKRQRSKIHQEQETQGCPTRDLQARTLETASREKLHKGAALTTTQSQITTIHLLRKRSYSLTTTQGTAQD